jgi:phosphoribosylanthranilate isomerase
VNIEIKICGLTNAEDALCALEAGADFLGFVLYAGSPRAISTADLARVLQRIGRPVRAVGVFVNTARAVVETVASDCGLCAAQIHGDEEAREFAGMPLPVWRAVAARQGRLRPEPAEWPAARYVVDAAPPGVYGGAGVKADWDAARTLARRVPVMLAGGLTPDNVAEAVRAVRPAGVDVSSGVERAPGRKDWDKVKSFIRAAREAAAELES